MRDHTDGMGVNRGARSCLLRRKSAGVRTQVNRISLSAPIIGWHGPERLHKRAVNKVIKTVREDLKQHYRDIQKVVKAFDK